MKIILPIIFAMIGASLTPIFTTAQIQTGKSYVNITKGSAGGTFEPGDTLEIRATIAITGSNYSLTRVRFVDTISNDVTYVPGSLKILTNEGMVFRSYTDAGGDDPAMFNSTNKTLRINLSSSGAAVGICSNTSPTADATLGGSINYNGRPSFYGNTCIMSASYRIVINETHNYGTIINLHGGTIRYRRSGSDGTINFNAYRIALTPNLGLCSNSVGANAVTDHGGTFGSGTTQNRTTAADVPGYTRVNVGSGAPQDGQYAIVNNLSPNGTANPTSVGIPGGAARVHTVWDIMGDHTGATDEIAGNLPPATTSTEGGYFVVVNASYANGEAFNQPVGGLCGNTYYEFSAWLKNVCSYCGCDTSGVGATSKNFKGPDRAGVHPNLTFEIDKVAYYTTGNIEYSGNWVKKGFIFKTNNGQGDFTITIRNNAPGGGGNDWAIDDIKFATCSPELTFNPTPAPIVCSENLVTMNALVSSYFDNYTFWRWEKSTDGAQTWDNTGISGNSTISQTSPPYEYSVDYPQFIAPKSDSGHLYRLRIATSASDLDNDACSYANGINVLTLNVIECEVLASYVKTLSARLKQQQATLNWQVVNANQNTILSVEKSVGNRPFVTVASFTPGEQTVFSWTDPNIITDVTYYRIRITENGKSAYSNTAWVQDKLKKDFVVRAVHNPVRSNVTAELASTRDGKLTLSVIDMLGRTLCTSEQKLAAGVSQVQLPQTAFLPKGVYVLRIQWNEEIFNQRIVKE